jgi:hypothetical protein
MAALPAPVDPVPALPSLSLVPPPTDASHARPRPAVMEPGRPRVRRLVVFTGKIT